ncbi:unnamed protein product [Merluccius merluccius]
MASWICCNSCVQPPSAERLLAVTTCGHIVCNVCFQKGKPGECFICHTNCRVSPLSDKSSGEVKDLFSDVSVVVTRHFKEISKVLQFQASQWKRLLTHYQQRNKKQEEAIVKMRQEMQQMSKKLKEQSVYISKLETALQHQGSTASSVSQMGFSCHTPCVPETGRSASHSTTSRILQIPYKSPASLSRHPSIASLVDHKDSDGRRLFRKPDARLSLISPPQDGRMGTVPPRLTNQNTLANHSMCSATVSRLQGDAPTTFGRSSGWASPIFRPSSFRPSTSSLICPPR